MMFFAGDWTFFEEILHCNAKAECSSKLFAWCCKKINNFFKFFYVHSAANREGVL